MQSSPPYLPEGLVVHAPRGEGWRTLEFSNEGVLFGKKDLANGKTFVASTELLVPSYIRGSTVAEFAKYVSDNVQREFRRNGEITHISHVAGHRLGEYCVQSHIVLISNDSDSPSDDPFIEDWRMVMCLDPNDRRRLYRIGYSERAKRKDMSPKSVMNAESFIASVAFRDKKVP